MNGGENELLDRLAVSELCKGWAIFYDSSEWEKYRSLFTDDAYVWTSKCDVALHTILHSKHVAAENGPLAIDNFIAMSKLGKENGTIVMHRECGTIVELNGEAHRAVGKMKATISQRFNSEGIAFDIDCDCRFIFFCARDRQTWDWKVKFVKLFYEKDKIIPVNGQSVPAFTTEEELEMAGFPNGYRYLGIMQKRLGYDTSLYLPTCNNEVWDRIYEAMGDWLAADENELFSIEDDNEDNNE